MVYTRNGQKKHLEGRISYKWISKYVSLGMFGIKDTKLCSEVNGNHNYWFNYNFNDGQKYHFVIEQTFEDGIVMYKIVVDGEVVLSQQNNQPQNFNNVMAYVSDPWNPTFDGCMENLKFTPGNGNYIEFKIISFDYFIY